MKRLLIGLIMVTMATPLLAADPLRVYDSKGIDITTTRATIDTGWEIQARVVGGDILGRVIDRTEEYIDEPYLESGTDGLTFWIQGVGETPAIQAGDSVTFTYLTITGGGEVSNKIFFPAVTMDTLLYVGDDYCTYSNSALSTKVGMTPTPTLTPTPSVAPTSTPTPTPTPTASPAPSATPSPVTHNVGIVEFEELSANPTTATLVDEAEMRLYMKADKCILQFNDSSSQVHYFYLDLLSGVTTGITWTGQTTAP